MANIHEDAFKGILTVDRLKSYLSNDPSIIDSPGGRRSLTPLAAATLRGHLDVVRLLLENAIQPADPDALSIHNRTPLFFATARSPARNRGAIVRLLLNEGADVDLCFADDDYNTPLMNAIIEVRDKEVIHQLVDFGASPTKKNARGDTAFTLAKKRGMEAVLRPRDERRSSRDEIIGLLVALVMLVLSYINNGFIKGVVNGVVIKLYGISGAGNQTIIEDLHPKPEPTKIVSDEAIAKDEDPEPKPVKVTRKKSIAEDTPDSNPKPVNFPKGNKIFNGVAPDPQPTNAVRNPTINGKDVDSKPRSGEVINKETITKNLQNTKSEPKSGEDVKEESNAKAVEPEQNQKPKPKPKPKHLVVVNEETTAKTVNPEPKHLEEKSSAKDMASEPKPKEPVEEKSNTKDMEPEPKSEEPVEEKSSAKDMDPELKSKEPVEEKSNTEDEEPNPQSEERVEEESNAKDKEPGPKSEEPVKEESNAKDAVPGPKFEEPVEEEPNAKEIPKPKSMEEFQADLTSYVEDTGLAKFFAPGDRFLQDLAKNAAALQDDPLATPANMKRLTCLSLYQPVIYCDDSYSMSKHRRYQNQQELVNRIAAIATKIVPDNLGVELRFINAKDSSNLSAAEINNAMANVTPQGNTPIGTNLRKKILEPLVYDVLADASKKFQRPLLVCAITDGCPTSEHRSLFQRNIVECTRVLNRHGYEPNAVTFCISQIGDDREAAAFLDGLREDTEIQDVLYCTTDRLDKVYEELKENENRLEEWLLKTLTRPIMDRNEE